MKPNQNQESITYTGDSSLKMNIQSKLILKMAIMFLIVILQTFLYSCKTICRDYHVSSSKNILTVTKVKKMSQDVYVIYALRNDSIFKIVSIYNGNRQVNSKKLAKGMHFQVNLYSRFRAMEEKFNIIPPCNEVIEFHGITICKEPERGINDVWFCKELNGPFLNLSQIFD